VNAWLALLDEPDGELCATARSPDGERFVTAWRDSTRAPHPQARRLDGRVLDASGPQADVSLLWPDRHALPLFDDPAVVQARRTARTLVRPRCTSTLTVDSRHLAGSIWVPGPGGRLDEDPFRLLGVPLRLHVGPGLLGTGPPLAGPAQERYRGAPWPSGSF
jgi:hypothetical protein